MWIVTAQHPLIEAADQIKAFEHQSATGHWAKKMLRIIGDPYVETMSDDCLTEWRLAQHNDWGAMLSCLHIMGESYGREPLGNVVAIYEIPNPCMRLEPVYVDIRAMRLDDGDWVQDVDSPEVYAVYINNPMAMHIQDFAVSDGGDQLTAAYAFADRLADHLRCEVVSDLPRAVVQPVEISRLDETEAAMCLWEAYLEASRIAWAGYNAGKPTTWQSALLAHHEAQGWAQMRLDVLGMAVECRLDWERKVKDEGYDGSFDWDYCPAWLTARLQADLRFVPETEKGN
jgi:hypothetical protein